MRLMLISDRDECRQLVRNHIEIEWPKADIAEHRLGKDTALDVHFSAAGFDSVVLAGKPPCGRSSRPSFTCGSRTLLPRPRSRRACSAFSGARSTAMR